VKRIGSITAGVVLGAIVALTLPSLAQDTGTSDTPSTSQRTVTVSGTATIKASPDEAVIGLGVQTDANTAEGALSQNADKMEAVIASLFDQGLTRDDLATSYVSLYPTYGPSGMDISGYQAVNQIDATVRDIPNVGRVIDAAVDAGANLSNGITFRLSDESSGVDQALEAAVADARSKAETLAGAGDAQLGQVVSIQESSPSSMPPIAYDRAFAAAGAAEGAPTPVQPPTIETQVSVTVVWALS
jgi:uncharacterized protein YggE